MKGAGCNSSGGVGGGGVVTVEDQTPLVMAALCNRGAIIFLPYDYYLSIVSFFPRLISSAAGWMSTIL